MKLKVIGIASFMSVISTLAGSALAAETASGKVTSIISFYDDGRVKFTLALASGNLCGNNPGDAKARISTEDKGYESAVKLITSAYLAGKSVTITSSDTGSECHVETVRLGD